MFLQTVFEESVMIAFIEENLIGTHCFKVLKGRQLQRSTHQKNYTKVLLLQHFCWQSQPKVATGLLIVPKLAA